MTSKKGRNLLIFLLLFLGIGAVAGGGMLILSPSGHLLGLPLSALGSAPFTNFLIPGIILFLVLGILPCFLAFSLLHKKENKLGDKLNVFKDMDWSWGLSVYVAFILILWIQVEMIFENGIHWLHTFYIFLALLILFAALLPSVRSLYKK